MKKLVMTFFVSFAALGLSIGDAEARRMGGGKSVGMQRQAIAPKPATPQQQATPSAPATPAAAAAAAPKRNWMGPIAGLAAGLGIAALLSHFGLGEEMANLVMIALLAMAAVFVFKMLFRRSASATQAARPEMQYAGAGNSPLNPPPQAVPQGGLASSADAPAAAHIPADFDTEAFLRVAKLNFVRLQAANDARNIDDIREFTSPELFAEIRMQMDERGDAPQQTDVVRLDAELLEVATESGRHVVSVRFSGLIREDADGAANAFEEVWNLSKPVAGDKGWVVAGIQQPG